MFLQKQRNLDKSSRSPGKNIEFDTQKVFSLWKQMKRSIYHTPSENIHTRLVSNISNSNPHSEKTNANREEETKLEIPTVNERNENIKQTFKSRKILS